MAKHEVISVIRMYRPGLNGGYKLCDWFSCMFDDGTTIKVNATDELSAYLAAIDTLTSCKPNQEENQ